MPSVAARSSGSLKPVQAVASARPCSNATHTGLRNKGSTDGHDDQRRREPDQERWRRRRGAFPRRHRSPSVPDDRGTRPGLLVLEGPRLDPPALDRELARRLLVELDRGHRDAVAEDVR